jgi:hypothetical protein
VGELGGGFARVDVTVFTPSMSLLVDEIQFIAGKEGGRICVGLSGGAPRFVGLRRSFAAYFISWRDEMPAVAITTKMRRVFVLNRPDWRAAAAGGGTAGAEKRYSRRRRFADAASFNDIDGAGKTES